MKNLLKSSDFLFVIILFFLTISAEYCEMFSLAEDQTVFLRHGIRSVFRNQGETNFLHDKIVLVTFDDAFFTRYGKFPLTRTDLAKIIENINSLEAKVIAVDMMLDLPSSTGGDVELAESIKKRNSFRELVYPIPLFRNAGSSGYLNITSPSSVSTFLSRIRIWPEITEKQDEWPIAVKIVSEYLNVKPALGEGRLILGDISVPLDQFNDIYIDFSSIPNGYKFLYQAAGISASEFLDLSDLDEAERKELKVWIKNRIVILGETTAISHDWFDTPVGMIYGAEIIADTVNTLLKGAPLRAAPLWIEILTGFLFLGSLLLCTVMTRAPAVQTGAAVIVFAGFVLCCTFFYACCGLVISMTYNMISGITGFFVLALSSYFRERKLTILEKQAKEHAERELRVAEAATRMKSEFLANMSHEIRTPMNSILGFLELSIESPDIPESHKKNLRTAHHSAKSLLTLINDILDLSKLERGKLELEEHPFDLEKVIRETLGIFEVRCGEKGIDLSFHIHPGIAPYYTGDASRLRQIFINLVGNAVKFTEHGSITVNAVSCENNMIHFAISDTGIGIAAEKLEKIFDPFTQADSSTARRFGGTGLGTTISRQLAERMGGNIRAESEPGKGSTFSFTVRMEPTDQIPADRGKKAENRLPHAQRRFRILLAEDVEENIMLAKIRLEQQGHTVIEARNGRDAVKCFQREHPDIVLMDVHMPEMDGVEAAKAIRKTENEKCTDDNSAFCIPIIALTASMMKEEQDMFLESGMNAVAGKPVNFAELFAIMEKLVPENRNQKSEISEQLSVTAYQLPVNSEQLQSAGGKIRDDNRSQTPDHSSLPTATCSLNTDAVDMEKGMKTWQNEAAYKKALLGFARDYETAAEKIQSHLESGDRNGAYRILHTVKGVAGNLSLTEVYRIASELNAQVREKSSDELMAMTESLAGAIKTAVSFIQEIQPEKVQNSLTTDNCSLTTDNCSLRELLRELLASFGNCNPELSEPFLEQMGCFLSPQQIEPIQWHLDRFDFDKAGEEVIKLAQDIGIAIE